MICQVFRSLRDHSSQEFYKRHKQHCSQLNMLEIKNVTLTMPICSGLACRLFARRPTYYDKYA